jgi:phage terminase large subunit-like protein
LGLEVVDFMAAVGKPLDEWQALMVVDTFGLRPDGYWAAFECAGLVPRQNGKGAYTEAVELGGLFLFGDQIIMHSAHLFKTAKQSFQRLIDIIDGSDWLTKRVAQVVRARGDEEIRLTAKAGGGRLLCFSRSGGAGRGFTGDKTVFDECAYLTVEQYQAATPTLATVPNPQIIYTGTPPDEDVGPMPADAMMPSVRRRANSGGDRIALWEWSPPDVFDRSDPRLMAACNPSLGKRIPLWFLQKQLANFTAAGRPEKFDTEHLGLWPKDASEQWQKIPEAEWREAEDASSKTSNVVALSIEVNLERSQASIQVSGRRDGDPRIRHVYVRRAESGTAWVVADVLEAMDEFEVVAVTVDSGGPAGSLIPDLEAAGIDVLKPSVRDLAAACGAMRDGIAGKAKDGEDLAAVRNIRHMGQQPLTDAVAGLTGRKVSETEVWERAGLGFMAVGAATALWAHAIKSSDYDLMRSFG